jgi:hypothetical protein
MSVTLTETQTTVEWWTADPARTTVEFEVEHCTPYGAASAGSTACTSWARLAWRSS